MFVIGSQNKVTAEMKKQKKENELKKMKMAEDKGDKEVSGKNDTPGKKEVSTCSHSVILL